MHNSDQLRGTSSSHERAILAALPTTRASSMSDRDMSETLRLPQGNGEPSSPSRWRSATAHDVFADNRDEDIFGWVQPEEWETVAGPNKSNFMKGDCLECGTTEQTRPPAPLSTSSGSATDAIVSRDGTLQSCGAPSCGYGAQCCEYSRRATHTRGVVPTTPSSSGRPALHHKSIPEMAKTEQKNRLGVSLIDIIHGRSCRPISLLDLRTFLHFQRDPTKRLPSYSPASDMEAGGLDDLDFNLDPTAASKSLGTSASSNKPKAHYDEVDCLDFLVAYERYLTKFREQPRADRLKSPDPPTCQAAVKAYVRRQHKVRTSSDLTAVELLLQNNSNDAEQANDEPIEVSYETIAKLKPADLGLKPHQQPLRTEFDRLVRRYLCAQRHCIMPSRRKGLSSRLGGRKRHSGSSSETVIESDETAEADSKEGGPGSTLPFKMPRLRWLLNVGLLSEDVLELALAECDFSTHPDVLAPIAEAVYAYMSQHVVPYFFIHVARNLSPNTKRGRLLVGIACTLIALLFTVLLVVAPSPLAPHANHGTGDINRWWRLTLTPIWCAGLGYILAYFTGLCVWLTLRGNREPDEEEEREREEIRSRISSEEVLGFDLTDLQADVDERDAQVERDTNRWMAPEIADILTGISGQKKKDKHRRQASASESSEMREAEEGRQRTKSNNDEETKEKEVTFIIGDQSTGSQGLRPGQDSGDGIEMHHLGVPVTSPKPDALTAPAAVILSSKRRSLASPLTESQFGSRVTPTASTTDLGRYARPSMEVVSKAGSSSIMSDVRSSESGSSVPTTNMIRHKRVPLLNFSIGMVKNPASELVDEQADGPVLTRDALLFDPELAAKVASPTKTANGEDGTEPTTRAARSSTVGSGSGNGSPPALTRRLSLAGVTLPTFRGTAKPKPSISFDEPEYADAQENIQTQTDHVEIAMPAWPEPSATAASSGSGAIAPWETSAAKTIEIPSATRSLLFSPPSAKRSRFSTATSSTAYTGPTKDSVKRWYESSPKAPLKHRFWKAIQRGTGFAVGTEKVLDARVRRAQQMKALRIMAINTLATVVVMVIVVAIP